MRRNLLSTIMLAAAVLTMGCKTSAPTLPGGKAITRAAKSASKSPGEFQLYGNSRLDTALELTETTSGSTTISYATEAQVFNAIETANAAVVQAASAEARAVEALEKATALETMAKDALTKAQASTLTAAAATAAADLAKAQAEKAAAAAAAAEAKATTAASQAALIESKAQLALERASTANDSATQASASAALATARAQSAASAAAAADARAAAADAKAAAADAKAAVASSDAASAATQAQMALDAANAASRVAEAAAARATNLEAAIASVKLPGTVTVTEFGAKGDGVTDDTSAIQRAIDATPNGGVLQIPAGTYVLSSSVKSSNKTIALHILGTLKDRFQSWTENANDTTLEGKGILAFRNCRVSIIGSGSGTHLDGSQGDIGLAANRRNFLYFFECPSVKIKGLNGVRLTKSAILGVGCSNVSNRLCNFSGGQFAVTWTRGSHIDIDNVTIRNCEFNGITVHNRGFFINAIYPESQPTDVRVSNCYVYDVASTNAYAVGITVDYCKDFNVIGNLVDGNGVSTMGYSFAKSSGGEVVGNRVKNLTRAVNGTYGYCGIGMEVDTVSNVSFQANTFDECLIGYLVLASSDCSFSGIYKCDVSREGEISTAAGSSGMFVLGNTSVTSNRLLIHDCISNGGNYFLRGTVKSHGLRLRDCTIFDPLNAAILINPGSTLTDTVIEGISYTEPASARRALSFADNTCLDLSVRNCTAQAATAPNTGQRFLYATAVGGRYKVSNCTIVNFDEGVNCPYSGYTSELSIRDCEFRGVANYYTIANTAAKVQFRDNSDGGASIGKVVVTSSAYTAKPWDRLVLVNNPGPVTITLPATQPEDLTLTVKDTSGQAVTNPISLVASAGSSLESPPAFAIRSSYGSLEAFWDSGTWRLR